MGVAVAKNYRAEISIQSSLLTNPTILDWTGFSVTNRYGDAEATFDVDLRRPINLNIGDTITITDGFGDTQIPLVQNKEIEGDGGSLNQARISGNGSKITRRGPTKSLVFVNQTWLSKRCPSYYLYNNGSGPNTTGYSSTIILQYNPGGIPIQYEGVARNRLLLAELPGKDVRDNEFGCIVSSGITRIDIATRIASMCGYTIKSNMPWLPIQKTYTIHATQTYWQSLQQLFADWKPMIFIRGTEIWIMDIGVDRQAKTTGDTIQLAEDAFSLYEWNSQKNFSPVDHILISGPDSVYTYSARKQMISKRTYSEVDLPGADVTLEFEETEEDQLQDEIEKTLYGNGMSDRVVKTHRTIVQRQDMFNPENCVPITENIKTYSSDGTELSEIQSEYKYAAYNKPIKCTTTQYGRIGKVGGGVDDQYGDGLKQTFPVSWSKEKLSESIKTFRDYYEDIGQVETDVQEWALCLAYKDQEEKDGETYTFYDQTQPLWQALQSGIMPYDEPDEDGNGWMTAWQLYKQETVRFDKASPSLYRKTRNQTVYYPQRVSKPSYEDIPIPRSRQNSVIHKKWEYFWLNDALFLYTGGNYPVSSDPAGWHPRIDISCPDVIDETTARKIAYRQIASNPSIVASATVETTLPLHSAHIGGTLSLPACRKQILTYNEDGTIAGYREIVIEAKTYWIVGHTRVVQYMGDINEGQKDMRVYDRIELKEFF